MKNVQFSSFQIVINYNRTVDGCSSADAGIDEQGLAKVGPASALMDMTKYVNPRLQFLRDEPQQIFTAGLHFPGILVQNTIGRHVGDQDINTAGDLLPLLS